MTESREKAVLMMAGGTGGHVFPALTVAETLRAKGVPVTWLGTLDGLESKLVGPAGFPLHYLQFPRIRGKGGLRWILAPFFLVRALLQAFVILHKVKPKCVVSMGGFAALPGGIAAWLLRIPLIVHEQNAVAGMTNRILAHCTKSVLTGFPQAFGPKSLFEQIGNPVRPSLFNIPPLFLETLQSTVRILILGGSQGAKVLNEQIPTLLSWVAQQFPHTTLQITHQTGGAQDKIVKAQYEQFSLTATVQPFIEDMHTAYEQCDIAVCRSGALTLAELAAAGRGAILIPFPHAVDDHQTRNAEWFSSAGAAILLNQSQLKTLGNILCELISQPEKIIAMSQKAKTLAAPLAAVKLAKACTERIYDRQH